MSSLLLQGAWSGVNRIDAVAFDRHHHSEDCKMKCICGKHRYGDEGACHSKCSFEKCENLLGEEDHENYCEFHLCRICKDAPVFDFDLCVRCADLELNFYDANADHSAI